MRSPPSRCTEAVVAEEGGHLVLVARGDRAKAEHAVPPGRAAGEQRGARGRAGGRGAVRFEAQPALAQRVQVPAREGGVNPYAGIELPGATVRGVSGVAGRSSLCECSFPSVSGSVSGVLDGFRSWELRFTVLLLRTKYYLVVFTACETVRLRPPTRRARRELGREVVRAHLVRHQQQHRVHRRAAWSMRGEKQRPCPHHGAAGGSALEGALQNERQGCFFALNQPR